MDKPVVLIAEDDDDLREFTAELLRDHGFAVSTARDGAEALRQLERLPPPDLLLLDLMMPNVDGVQVVIEVRRNPALALMPIVLSTACRLRLPPGVQQILFKPSPPHEIVRTVERYCRPAAAAVKSSAGTSAG